MVGKHNTLQSAATVGLLTVFVGLFVACTPFRGKAPIPTREPLTLILMITNDTRGYLEEPCGCGIPEGGVARRATRLKFERQQAAHMMVLDAGDSLIGDSDPALKTLGATSVEALNRLGYDAITLGPLDLVIGAERLRARIQEAKFAVVAANVRLADGGGYLAQPYVIRAVGGHQVALIGLAPQAEGKGLVITAPLATLREIMTEVTSQADIVIVLSHAGVEVDRAIAAQVPDVDVVVTGEASAPLDLWRKEDGGVPILHADVALPGHAGRNLGKAVLQFDAEGRLTDIQWSRTTLGPQIPSDPAMLEWVRSLTQE